MGSKGENWRYIRAGQTSQTPKDKQRDSARPTQTTLALFRMVSCKAVAALLVVHVAALLASQTEAFVPIFTYSEVQRMQEKERNKGQKKSLSEQQRSEEMGPLDLTEPTEEKEDQVIKLTAPMEIAMRMDSRQLEKYRAAVNGLLSKSEDSLLHSWEKVASGQN